MIQTFLGLRREQSVLVVDPVIPRSLDRLRVEMQMGRLLDGNNLPHRGRRLWP